MSTPVTFIDTSLDSSDHLRQAIDDKIDSLEDSTRALKSRQNELASVSRLPCETLAAIFTFHSLATWREGTDNYTLALRAIPWIYVTHVCRMWRKTALGHPGFWSHVNLTQLTPVGMAEILSRAKTAPLYLEADVHKWSSELVVAFGKLLKTHISRTRHLSICGGQLPTLLKNLTTSAPILESLSLSPKSPRHVSSESPQDIIPKNLFHRTAPSLRNLELECCDVVRMSTFLKGLRSLKISKLSSETRPKLEDMLGALNKMLQLEDLSLQSATPIAPTTGPFISGPSATLPSLSQFYISDSTKECALAISHLILPALTRLRVDAKSRDWNGEDARLVAQCAAQCVCGVQDIESIRSILFSGERKRAEVTAWTMPDAGVKVHNPTTLQSESVSARLMFTVTGHWNDNSVVTSIFDALLAHLHVDSVSTLSALNHTRLSKEFWLNQAPRLSFLERVRLVPAAVKAFRDILAEDAPPDGPRFPLLTKLTITHVTWTLARTYHFRDMLRKRVEQGVPLQTLDLNVCDEPSPPRAEKIFAEIVVDVQGSLTTSRTVDEQKLRSRSCKKVEYDPEKVEYDTNCGPSVQESWYGLDYSDSEEEEDYNVYECDCDCGHGGILGSIIGVGVDMSNIQEELDPEDGLPYGW